MKTIREGKMIGLGAVLERWVREDLSWQVPYELSSFWCKWARWGRSG